MIRMTTFAGRRVAVVGLGGSGRATAHALVAGGADVICWDDGAHGRDQAVAEGLTVTDLIWEDWGTLSAIVLSPGIPLTHPRPHWSVTRAHGERIPILGDVGLFFKERASRFPDARVIAITGTNGKSTTTALTAHLMGQLGFDVEMGGNIGRAVLTLDEPDPNTVFVLEVSSYQIDLAPKLTPDVGVLLNVTPDHIDRHGTLERYAAIKARLPEEADHAVVSLDDAWTQGVAKTLENSGRLYAFTTGKGAALIPKLYAIGTTLFVHEQDGAHASSREIASLEGIGSLRGQHNVQNALASLTALRALADVTANGDGCDPAVWAPDRLGAALKTFPGLAHRLEVVGTVDGVLFVNDSKATNAEAAEKALSSFSDNIHWIAGGVAKAGGIASLQPYFERLEQAYLIGEAAQQFAATLDGAADVRRCETLDRAVSEAFAAAVRTNVEGRSQPVVLFSPACASFDQYNNFEDRGEAFRQIVSGLPGYVAPGRGTAKPQPEAG
ncbi:MAG: UDP-N-acetylmuramoyl-L-alanine--D-glutamate ligase [Pseudomonadota bacterium]